MIASWSMLAGLAGGIGLFLLGMTMMTEGLKLAAGPMLDRVLARATRTRWRALLSGALMTAVVQSSSAVTVAAIGFVNAGMMTLAPALWVLFGANLGTTMTGWIVALVGLKFDIEALALPLIGAGVVMRLTGTAQRRGALGGAIAGLGLLFLGIAMLQEAFVDIAATVELPRGHGLAATVAQVAVGALLTVLMQSSSASMTVALTAAQGGLMTPEGAAAMVIGANIGTTVKAVLATIGATPNARRAAAAHVIFNVLTGVAALVLLPWLVGAIAVGRDALGLTPDPAAQLALFHTLFNLLGVLLMWPLAAALTRWLGQRFRAAEDDEGQPRHLDDNVLQVPSLALQALDSELARLGHVAVRAAQAVAGDADGSVPARDLWVCEQIDSAVDRFVERLNRSAMTPRDSSRLSRALRVQRCYQAMAEQTRLAMQRPPPAPGPPLPATLDVPRRAFLDEARASLSQADPLVDPLAEPRVHAERSDAQAPPLPPLQRLLQAYRHLEAAWLAAGAGGVVRLSEMEAGLRRAGALRRAIEQAVKAMQLVSAGPERADPSASPPAPGP